MTSRFRQTNWTRRTKGNLLTMPILTLLPQVHVKEKLPLSGVKPEGLQCTAVIFAIFTWNTSA